MRFDYRPVILDVESGDRAGMLVFRGEALLAVAVRLGALHGEQAGWWFAEFVFHPRVETPRRPYATMGELDAWLGDQLG